MQTLDQNAQIVLQGLASLIAKQQGFTTKATSGTPNALYGHGTGGLFSGPGRERPVFSAMALNPTGLQAKLPLRKSNTTNPLFDLLTGVTGTVGSEPTTACGDFPQAGTTKLCTHSFVFGRQGRSSTIVDISRVGETTNRGELYDYQFIGNPLGGSVGNNPAGPSIPGLNSSGVFNNEATMKLFELAVAWARDFAKELYTGNPINNNGEGRKYFYGLDTLINEGYRDAETGAACSAADSVIRSFGNQRIDANPAYAVRLITAMFNYLQNLAQRAGLAPLRLELAMRWELFYQLTEIWPCAYQSYRCQAEGSSEVVIDATKLTQMRDEMRGDSDNRTGQYLLIDGQKVMVSIDDAIAETESNGVFTSQIYFVPMTVLGRIPVTYIDYFDFNAPGAAMDFAGIFGAAGYYKTSDDGRFLWHTKPPENYCLQLQALTRPRLMLLTPHVAGRLTNVSYTSLFHERSMFTDSPYYYNGGKTNRIGLGPTFYSPVA